MGIFAVTMAIVGILNTLAGFGVSNYVIRAKELPASTLDSAFTINAALSCAVASAILLASIFARSYFNSPDVAQALLPLSVSAVISIFEFRPATMLQREMRFRMVALIQTLRGFIGSGLTLVLAVLGHGYMSLPYGNVASALVGAAVTNMLVREHFGIRMSLSEARAITTFGIRMMSIGGAGVIVRRASEILLGNLLGLAMLGLYSRASSISTLIFDNAYSAVARVLFVRFSAEMHSKGTMRDLFIASFEVLTALLWPIQLGLAVLSGPAIYYLYGVRWVEASMPLSILMITQCVSVAFAMNWDLFVLKDETARQAKIEFVIAAVGLSFFSIGCLFNIVAVASARFAEALFGFSIYYPHMLRLSDVTKGQIPKVVLRNALLSAVAVAPSLILMVVEHWSYKTPLLTIIAAVVVGVVLWLLLLIRMSHPLALEMRKIVLRDASRT
jgi:O-antigen/teichoic acid export membrane protein